ncbi:hypothetical protein JW926_01435, partial [Candidatus Sumerlaeota bacterium]|nr:hypothetical protein [Candidatus Sumerlaeota bacterium]
MKYFPVKRFFKFGLLFFLIFSTGIPGYTQYELYRWANFEDGGLYQGSIILGDFGGNAIKVVDLTKVTGVHPAFHAGMA